MLPVLINCKAEINTLPAGAEPLATCVSISLVIIEKVSEVSIKVPPPPVPELEALITCPLVLIAEADKIVILPANAFDDVLLMLVEICPVSTEPLPEIVILTVPPIPVPELDALMA